MALERIFYLTKNGLSQLEADLVKIKSLRKSKLGKTETPSVLSSEELNAEFVSFKEELDYLDSKIEELEHVLKHFQLIKKPPPSERNKAALGAEVIVEVNGQTDKFQLVGTLEANPSQGRISNKSPVGQALLGLQAGDQAALNFSSKVVYKIKKVSFSHL